MRVKIYLELKYATNMSFIEMRSIKFKFANVSSSSWKIKTPINIKIGKT